MATTRDDAAELIERYIRNEFHIGSDDPDFTRDTHLYDSGYVDSMGVVELISFVQSTFGIEIPDEEVFSDAFTSVNGISGVVERCVRHSSREPHLVEA